MNKVLLLSVFSSLALFATDDPKRGPIGAQCQPCNPCVPSCCISGSFTTDPGYVTGVNGSGFSVTQLMAAEGEYQITFTVPFTNKVAAFASGSLTGKTVDTTSPGAIVIGNVQPGETVFFLAVPLN